MLKISGGRVYDPVHGLDGEVRDLYVENGKLVPALSGDPVRTIDARGLVVMAGGVDMHAHIAGPKVNLARKLTPDRHRQAAPMCHHQSHGHSHRSGLRSIVPNTFATGYMYAGMGYTTVVDAAVAPIGARHAHEEFADTPVIDRAMLLCMGNNGFVLEQLDKGDEAAVRHYVAWQLAAAKAYGIKIVNPGGTEAWKSGGKVAALSDSVGPYRVRPRDILATLARTGEALGLPHAVHIHGNNLGLPGNWDTTLETMRVLEGHRAHLTHIQFHSYGGEDYRTMASQVPALVEYVNAHPNLTVDVGQVMFEQVVTMTADNPWQHYLSTLTGERWASVCIEAETGCGVVPYEYKNRSVVNTLQWAIGLEWMLLMADPWRIALTTDHPNGGSFMSYPAIIKLLMSREARREAMTRVDRRALERTTLPDLDREYTLREIAIVTRAAPARILGLAHKGHLGPGADADITLYHQHPDPEQMFLHPRYVIKGGAVVVDEGELRLPTGGRTFWVAPGHDPAVEERVRAYFEQWYTVQFENYPVQAHDLDASEVVPCR